MSIKRLSPEKLKRRQMAYWRAKLKQDQYPADPAVVRLFTDLQVARRNETTNHGSSERDAWNDLLRYLTTFEVGSR